MVSFQRKVHHDQQFLICIAQVTLALACERATVFYGNNLSGSLDDSRVRELIGLLL